MFAKTFYLASRLVLPPLVLAHVSLAEYGLWSACFVLIMYIGLTDVGFSSVYIRFSARYHAQCDTAAINRLLSTGVFTLTALSTLALFSLWLLLPEVLDFLKVVSNQRTLASNLVMGTAAMFMLDLTMGAYCYLLHGIQRVREEQKVAVTGYILELLLIAAFLQAGMGIYSLLAAFVLRYVWSLTSFMRLAHRYLPGLRISIRNFDTAMLRHFFGYGSAIQISTFFGTALFSIDRVIAGVLFGPQGIALFELAVKLPMAANSVPSVISNVTMPAVSKLSANNDLDGIRDIYRKASRSTSLISAIPLGFMAAFAAPISLAWLGNREDLQLLPLILTLTAVWSHLHTITGPGSAAFRGMGKIGNEFVYHILRIACLAIACCVLTISTSITYLALALAGGSALSALCYLLYNQQRMGLPMLQLFREIIAPGFVVYPIAYALLWSSQIFLPPELSRWERLIALLLFGAFYCGTVGLVSWKWLLLDYERASINQLWQGLCISTLKWRRA